MGKDLAMIHKSYKTWLCNAALFALICAAFGAGVLLGPIVTARGKEELTRNLHCSPDGDKTSQFASNPQRRLKSECISRGQLKDFMKQWSRTLGDLIEKKMLNATKRKLNHAIRKFSKNKDVQTQRTMEALINNMLANWTSQLLQQNNVLMPSEKPVTARSPETKGSTERKTVKSTTKPDLEVIEVDFVEPTSQDTSVSIPVPIALYPLNGKYKTWDVSGRSNPNGNAHGVRLAPGPDGNPQGSYQFSGKSSSFIAFPNKGALTAKYSITLLAWVNVESKGGPLFNYNPKGWGVSLWVNSKLFLAAKFIEDDSACRTCLVSALPLKENVWSYVGMSYDRTSGIAKLLVNGRVSSKRNIGTTIGDLSTSWNVRMGARATKDGNYFKGRISRMQVYDRALTQREVEVVSSTLTAGICPQGWTGFHSSCYLLFNRLTNQWNHARQVCREHGGDLVKIESPEENHFVYTLAYSKAADKKEAKFILRQSFGLCNSHSGEDSLVYELKFPKYMWIGLLRGSSSEQFAWVHTSPPILYSNWAIEEPNNLHGRGENCGHIYIWKGDKAMQWNDELCVNPTIGPMIFMCEMKLLDLELKPINSGNSVIEGGSGEGESGSGESASGWASGDVNTFPSRLD